MKRNKRPRDAAQNNDRDEEPLTMSGGTKRRPLLHSNNCNYRTISISICNLLLLLASSSSYLVSATKDNDSGKPTNLRRNNNNNNNKQQKQRSLANSPLCPSPQSTGTYPTKNCVGYIHCTNGIQSSNIIQCSSGTLFDYKSGLCTWPHLLEGGCKVGDELLELDGEDTADNNNNEENDEINQELHSLDNYCPPNYTGLAPLKDCIGYVDCQNGIAKRSKACNSSNNLKFDIMTLSCVANMNENDCEVYYNIDDAQQKQLDDATVNDGNEGAPTQSPNSNKRNEYQTQIISCPPTFTGYKSLPGCTSYIYCRDRVEEGRYTCGSGTIYNGEICVWAQDYQCDTTLIPTYTPSSSPTYEPSNTPSYSPTPLDITKPIYYPNFMKGICLNDGNQPSGVDKMYLFSTSTGCCSTYFPSNLELCIEATAPTPAPSPTLGAIWYPDYTNNICLSKNDLTSNQQPSIYETNFFYTYQECCAFNYISNKSHCLNNKPNMYYPDYYNNICLNDGKQSIWEDNLYDSYVECCYMDWIDSDVCMKDLNSVVVDAAEEEGGGNDMDLAVYYPDIENNVCHCDGQSSENEMNFFSSYNSCCEFDWFDDIGTTLCKHAKPVQELKCIGTIVEDADDQGPRPSPNDNTIYYPDRTNSICLDDDQGFKQAVEYSNIRDCCNDPWITYETCISHAIMTYPAPPPTPSPIVSAKQPVWNPWYPDYVYQLCRNDGKQSRDTANLFVEMKDCCMAEYMDTDACLANT